MNTEEFEKQLKQLLQEKKYDEIPKLLSKSSEHFWAEVYPKKSKEEKISDYSFEKKLKLTLP